MAARYWVGGTAAWDGTAGTKWALTSGGAGGQAVPTSADDVFFDGASGAVTCTVSTGRLAKSINCTGFTGTLTGTGTINVAGSITLVAGMTYSHTGTITISGTGTLTTAGKAFSATVINGSGITVSLGDNLNTATRNVTVTQGTFTTTTNNYSITAGSLVSSGSLTRAITLNNSTATLSGSTPINFVTSGTFNAGTSTLLLSNSTGTTFTGGGKTFYNVTYSGGALQTSNTINGANTYNNLSVGGAGLGSSSNNLTLGANIVVNGTFTVAAGTGGASARIVVRSSVIGTPRTITAAAVSLTYVDFRSINGAGAAAPFTGTSIGNAGGNTGITFTTPKNVYWNLPAGGQWYANAWATSAGGAVSTANYPLPQDTAYFVDIGLNTSATVSLMAVPNSGINASGRTLAMSLTPAGDICGDMTLSSAVTVTSNTLTFYNAPTFTRNSATLNCSFTVSNIASLTLGGAVSTAGNLAVNGTLTLNNYQFQCGTINLGSGATTNFGTGNLRGTSSGSVFSQNNTHTVTGTPVVNLTYSGGAGSRTVSASLVSEANAVDINITAGTDNLFINGSAKNVNLTGWTGALQSGARTIYGDLTFSAGSTTVASVNTTTFAATSGTQILTTNGVVLDFPVTQNGVGGTVQLNSNLTLGATRNYTLVNGTFSANNYDVTASAFVSSYTNVRAINMGSGTWTLSGSGPWQLFTSTNLTLNPGTSTIVLSGTGTTRTFDGGGLTYNTVVIGGNTVNTTFNISGSNTFNTLSSTNTVAHTINFGASTTNTFTNFNISGTAGNVVTIGSITAASHTLAKAGGGTVTVDYASISRSTATPTLTWLATNSTDGGNNSGWYFGAFTIPSTGNFFLMFG